MFLNQQRRAEGLDEGTHQRLTQQATALGQNTAWVDAIALHFPRWSHSYRATLDSLRGAIQKAYPLVLGAQIDAVQERLTKAYHGLFVSWHETAIALLRKSLGEPPCPYAWVGSGSFSRGEVLPYSDLEYMFLFEPDDRKTRGYFWACIQLITFQAHSLQEPDGLHPDQYPEVDLETDEQNTVYLALPKAMSAILQGLRTACRAPSGVYTQVISALQGKVMAGEEKLWKAYLKELEQINLRKVFQLIIPVSIADYEKTWGSKSVCSDAQQDAKQGYGFFLTYLMVMLKFYHGVKGDSTQEIIQALVDAKVICTDLGGSLAWAAREIQALRYRTHMHYRASYHHFMIQPDKSSDSQIYRTNPEETKTLAQIQVLLKHIYTHLRGAKQLGVKGSPDLVVAAEALTAYNTIHPPLFMPGFNQEQRQTLLRACITDPKQLKAHLELLDFSIKQGARADEPGLAGISSMRKVLVWANEEPDLALDTWRRLLKAGGDLEEQHYQTRLIEQAMEEDKPLAFAVLGQLGAGRESDAAVLLKYIRMQFENPHLDTTTQAALNAALPVLMQQNPLLDWYLTLDIVKQETHSNIILEGVKTPKGYLNRALHQALYKDKGRINSINTYGRRDVAFVKLNPLISVYAKFYPELPGIEEAIKLLALSIFSNPPIPYSELFAFHEGKEHYPVLLSQSIQGDNFQSILNAAYRDNNSDALAKLNAINPVSFSELFILSLLMHPEDGKPDNYILSPCTDHQGKQTYSIVGIDNDHALVPVFTQDSDDDKAFQIKTIVFTLPHMKTSLHDKAIQHFLQHDPQTAIRTWLNKLIHCQTCYEALFSTDVRAQLFKQESLPQIVLPPNSVEQLYERWVRLKQALTLNPGYIAMELLVRADPRVGLRYQAVFDQHSDPLSRFHAIASPAYMFSPKVGQYKTLVTSSQLLKSAKMTQQLVLQGRVYGPKQAKENWFAALHQSQAVSTYAKSLNEGDVSVFELLTLSAVKEAVLKETDFKEVIPEVQKKFIKQLLNRDHGLIGITSLTLVRLSALTGKDLQTLLNQSQGCQHLRLVDLGLKTLLSITLPEGLFIQLQELPVEKLELHAPKLKTLVLNKIPKLISLDCPKTKTLKTLNIQDCPQFQPTSLETLLKQSGIPLSECDFLKGLARVSPALWKPYIEKCFGEKISENTLLHLCEVIRDMKEVKTIELHEPKCLFEDCLNLLAALIYHTSVEVFLYKGAAQHHMIDLQALRMLKHQFQLRLTLTELEIIWKNGEPPVFHKVLQALNWVETGLNIYYTGTLAYLFSLQPSHIHDQLLFCLKQTATSFVPLFIRTEREKKQGVFVKALSMLGKVEVINALVNALGDKDRYFREAVVSALGQLGQATPQVINAVINALKDEENEVREAAVSALGQLGQATPEVTNALINSLRDERQEVRKSAAKALGHLGQASPEVIKAASKALGQLEQSPQVICAFLMSLWDKDNQQSHLEALGQLGKATPAVINAVIDTLINAMGDKDLNVRDSAVRALGQWGQVTPQITKALVNALRNKDFEVRITVASTLGQLGKATPEVTNALVNALKNQDLEFLITVASALRQLGQATPQVTNALVNALGDEARRVRVPVVLALGQLGTATPEVTNALVNALEDKDWKVQVSVVHALGQLGQATLVINALANALGDNERNVRESAIRALWQLGEATPEVINALVNALRNKDLEVRITVASALGQLGQATPEVINALIKALEAKNRNVRQTAANALGQLGQAIPEATTALVNALQDKDCKVRESAVSALVKLGQTTPEVINALIKALEDEFSFVRQAAANALGQLGRAKEVLKEVIGALRDYDNVAKSALVLKHLGQVSPALRKKLIGALRDENDYVRASSACALGQFVQATPDIIKALVKALGDKNWMVRRSAETGLRKLREDTLKALGTKESRESALCALAELGQASSQLIMTVVQESPNRPSYDLKKLLEDLQDKDMSVRESAAAALELGTGEATPEVINALIKALEDEFSFGVRAAAARTLGNLGQDTPEVMKALNIAAYDRIPSVSASAGLALVQLGHEECIVSIPGLIEKFIRHPNRNTRGPLKKLGENSPFVISQILNALEDENMLVRDFAASMLDELRQCPINLPLLFRFKPAFATLILPDLNMDLLKLSLSHTQGTLEYLQIGEQPPFYLKPLCLLNMKQWTWRWLDDTQQVLLIVGDASNLDFLLDLLFYVFQGLVVQPYEEGYTLADKEPSVLNNVIAMIQSLRLWLAEKPQLPVDPRNTVDPKVAIEPKPEVTPLTLPKPTVSLLISTVSKPTHFPPYLATFTRYREPLLRWVQTAEKDKKKLAASAQTLIQELLSISPTPLERYCLIEALDWVRMKINAQSHSLTIQREQITLAEAWIALRVPLKDWSLGLKIFQSYALFLQTQSMDDPSAQDEHDRCVILWAYVVLVSTGKAPTEAAFIRSLKDGVGVLVETTGQRVYDPALKGLIPVQKGIKSLKPSSPLTSLLKTLRRSAQQRLPLDRLNAESLTLGQTLTQQQQAHTLLVQTMQTQLKAPLKAWRWQGLGVGSAIGTETHPHRFGGKQGIRIRGLFHLKQPFDPKTRLTISEGPNFSAVMGSTYSNSDKPFDEETTLCLDANYQLGDIGATSDGYGHFKDPAENDKVHAAAYQIVKRMTRYVNLYTEPQQLVLDIQELFKHVGQSMKYSFMHPEEGGTASCVVTRVFRTAEGLCCVAAGIGDGLVAIFDTESGQWETLIKPRQYRRGQGPFTPLSTTKPWAHARVQVVSKPVSPHALILRMTDGAWEALPHQVSKPIPDPLISTTYLEYTLDNPWLKDNRVCTPHDLRVFLQEKIQKHIEMTRLWLVEEKRELAAGLISFLSQQSMPKGCTVGEYAKACGEKESGAYVKTIEGIRALVAALKLDGTGLEEQLVVDLLEQLEHVGLGDDITLHIQAVSGH